LVIAQGVDGAYGGAIGGSGSVDVAAGGQTLVLIASGTVQAGAASLGATVLNDSRLVIAQGVDGAYGGAIGGSGSVDVAAGGQTLVL
ncbi:hypothetical protein CTI14_65785, partial [Methylobacterium radiotolerans]